MIAFFLFPPNNTRVKKSYWISLIVYPLIAIGMFCLFFFIKGDYSQFGWGNALFFAGAMTIGSGLLVLLVHFGSFDFIVYGFRSIFKHMNPNYTNSSDKYPDYYAYHEAKTENRQKVGIFVIPWLIFGLIPIIVGFFLV